MTHYLLLVALAELAETFNHFMVTAEPPVYPGFFFFLSPAPSLGSRSQYLSLFCFNHNFLLWPPRKTSSTIVSSNNVGRYFTMFYLFGRGFSLLQNKHMHNQRSNPWKHSTTINTLFAFIIILS